MTINQVIGVLAMRHLLVTAVGAMHMVFCVRVASVGGSALVGIGCIDGQPVLIRVCSMWGVKMPIVQIVGMAFVNDGEMSAARPVDVRLDVTWMMRA